jgi:o-succinylbenzoic acid (OSB) synthetase
VIRLDRVSLREIRLPLVEPFETSAGTVGERRILLLALADIDGTETWSECVAETLPTYSPDTVDTCWLALSDWIIPIALGQQFNSAGDVHDALTQSVRGHRMARAAVEMGMWSLSALQKKISLAELLTGESEFARTSGVGPRTFVESGIAIGMHATPAALVDRASVAAAAGYRRIKLKIAPGKDVAFARAAHDAFGSTISISVDANGSYSLENADHRSALAELDKIGLGMIEQPLAHDDLVYHAELQQLLSTPVCLDESIWSDARTEEMLALGSARIVNLKPGRVGGFREALAIHDRCGRAGVPVWCGGMLESGIGRGYNVALASLPNFTIPGDLSPSARYWNRDVIKQPWTMDSYGRVRVPLDKPGAGIDVDTDFVDSVTVRKLDFKAK